MLIFAFCGGVGVGVLGALVGVGGGFIIVPALALLVPGWTPAELTAFSLAVVMGNAAAGSAANLAGKRADVRSALWFALATLPGAALGATASMHVARRPFETGFGAGLIALGGWLLAAQRLRRTERSDVGGPRRRHVVERAFVDVRGEEVRWRFPMPIGLAGAAVVGFVSSFFGIGGGVVHVPFLVSALGYPEHAAAATSLLVLVFSTAVGVVVHAVHGDYARDLLPALVTASGAIAGGFAGARVSTRVSPAGLRVVLAAAVTLAGLRLILR